jgi:YNFM family putative membrane transporter
VVSVSDTTTTARTVLPGHLPGSAGYRRIMTAMFAAGMATFVLLYDTQALLPELRAQFLVTPTQATLTLSLATAGLAAALLVAGPASERIGRTRLILGAVWAASLLGLLCPLAPSWHTLLGLRILQGIALAGLPAVATAYLREELHPTAQARAAGLYIGGTAIGGMAGRLLTAPVADAVGWRWGLAAAGVFALACALVVTLALPASEHFQPRAPGQLHLAALSRAALADPALRALYLLGACSAGALVGVYNALGFRLTGGPFHLGLGAVSLIYLVYVLGTLSSTVSGLLADRFGRRAILPSGCALAITGVLLTLLPWLPAIVVGMAGLTAGFFVVHGLASGWVAARAHLVGASASQAAAFYLCAYYAGSSVFGSLGGSAWAAAGWSGVSALALVLLLATLWLARRLRRTPALTPTPLPTRPV